MHYNDVLTHCAGTQRAMEKNEEKAKEIKGRYERQLTDLKTELRSLKSARKEHAKAMKKNVRMYASNCRHYALYVCTRYDGNRVVLHVVLV